MKPRRRTPPTPTGELTLRRTLELVLHRNPRLLVAEQDRCVGLAQVRQAGLTPNPELSVDVEDWLGSGDLRFLRSVQATTTLSQPIEISGKRRARLRAARLAKRAVDWTVEIRRRELLAETTEAFLKVLHAQAHLALHQDLLDRTEGLLKAFNAPGRTPSVTPADRAQAALRRDLARVALHSVERELAGRRRELAATWGQTEARFAKVTGRMGLLAPVPPLREVLAGLAQHPRMLRSSTRLAQRRAEIQLEQANAWPDLTLRVGYRWQETVRDSALVTGISIPLPLFSRNQGNLEGARHQLARSRYLREHLRFKLTSEASRAHTDVTQAHDEARSLQERILPSATRALEAALTGFDKGTASPQQVLLSLQTWSETRNATLAAQLRYHLAAIALRKLSGGRLRPARAVEGPAAPTPAAAPPR